MKLGLVRRGFSPTGGAEAYLRRFADAAALAGHQCVLFASGEWAGWRGEIIRVAGRSPRAFADALERTRPHEHCDFLFSLERVWRCDAYRAGDGVHAGWLERRAKSEPSWKKILHAFNPKNAALLELETSLFRDGGAKLVIANSRMVKGEIEGRFGCAAERIHVVYNGVPTPDFPPGARAEVRRELGLDPLDYVVLFAGSGWERKGLRCAVQAMNAANLAGPTLLVAGRGNPRSMPGSRRVRHLGPRADIPRLLAAADAFLLPTIYDPFSNACLEALAAGLPVLTTRHNGFSEIIEPGRDGEVLDDPADVETVARAIERWASAEKRAAIRPRLIELGARFSIEENVRRTLALLSK